MRSLELDNPFSRIAIRALELNIRSLELQVVPSNYTSSNSRKRIEIRENKLSNSRERIAIRENGLSNSRERIAIRENELSNSRERITNPWERITYPWERIAQFDITIYVWLFLKIPMFLQGFRMFVIDAVIICFKN